MQLYCFDRRKRATSFSPRTDDGRIVWAGTNGPARQRWCLFVCALLLISPVFLPTQAQPGGGPALSVLVAVDRTVRLAWPATATAFVLEETDSLDSLSSWRAVTETAQVQGNQFSLLIAPAGKTRFFRLRQAQSVSSFQVARHTPLDGATEVGVTFRPQVFFSEPVNPASLTSENFFAKAAGVPLEANIVPANDGSFAWLFFKQAMPGGTRVRVTVGGSTIFSATNSMLLDADGDGAPGGVLNFEFTTVSETALPGTSLTGIVLDSGPDLIPRTADDVDPGADGIVNTMDDLLLLPIAGVRVYLLGSEDQVLTTGPNGRFHFDSVPVGDVKVVVDGRTASNPPTGMYFPEMVMDANMIAGVDNYTMLGMPVIYLPRLAKTILQDVSVSTNTTIMTKPEGASGLTDSQRQQLTIEVPSNSLVGADGRKLTSGQVGISTVPPELVRDMLPPGVLQHTFDVTVQAPGIATFSTPAPMTFPNVFNAAPGTQLNFLSFDHTTGRLVIEGTATVSADGLSVRTDPGTGVTHPGWHGLTPPGGPAGPTNNPPAVSAVCAIDLGTNDLSLASVAAGRSLRASSLAGTLAPNLPKALPMIVGETGALSDPALTWAAPAAGGDVCGLKVQIEIDGPLAKFMKKTNNLALKNQTFILRPFGLGTKPPKLKILSGVAKTYDEMFGPGKVALFIEDELMGAKITVTESLLHSSAPPDVTVRTFYLYRWINVTEPQEFLSGTSNTVAFRKTLADGPGNWSSIKTIIGALPTTVTTTFAATALPGAAKVFDLSRPFVNHQFQWEFDPPTATTWAQPVPIIVADGFNTVVGNLTLRGHGIDPARVNLNLEGYKAELKRVILSLRNVTARPPYLPPAGLIFPIYEFSASAPGLPPVVARRSVNGPGGTTFLEDNLNYVPGGATNYMDGPDQTLGTTDDVFYQRWVRVRGVFEQLFQGFMPENRHLIGPDGIAGSPDDDFDFLQLATLDGLIDAEAGKLAGLVAQQFQRVNFLNSALQFTNVGATINCEWTDVFVTLGNGSGLGPTSPGKPVFGQGTGGRDTATLRSLLPAPKLPLGAKFWALAEGLNVNAANQIWVSVAKNLNYSGPDSFAADIANTISHEIGHTFGLVDAYTEDNKVGTALCRPSDGNCTPFDIMQAGATTDPYLPFAPGNIGLLKAAVGVSSLGPLPLAKNEVPLLGELRQYRKTFNLPSNSTGIRENNPLDPPPTQPEISVFQQDNSFFGEADESMEIPGEIAADGPGGDFIDVPFTILNSGYGPLTLSSLAFAAGTKGFTLVNANAILGRPITPGRSTNLIVRFDPSVDGTASDTLQISSDADAVPLLSIPITATAYANAPTAQVELVGNNNFGGVLVGAAAVSMNDVFRVSNLGQTPLHISAISLLQGTGIFSLTQIPGNLATQPIQLAHGQSFTFGGRFLPDRAGLRRALIDIKTDDLQTPVARVSFVGTGLVSPVQADWGDDFVVIESPDFPETPPLRVKSDDKGNFEFFLPSQVFYHLVIFDPVTGLVGHETDTTTLSGQRTLLVDTMVFKGSTEPDSDYDGLPDDIEFAIGTSPLNPDTDGDGIDDFAEIEQGLDPLGGRGFPIGIVGRVPLAGEAKKVVVISWPDGLVREVALVASGAGGLALVDVTDFSQPVLLNQFALPGDATDVAFDPDLAIAVVTANEGGVHFVDIGDLTAPRLLRREPANAHHVEIFDSNAWVATPERLESYSLTLTGARDSVELGRFTVKAMAREGANLFIVVGSLGSPYSSFRVFDLLNSDFRSRLPLNLLGASSKEDVSLSNGFAYIADETGGYSLVDITDPDQPKLISRPDPPFAPFLSGKAMAVDTSGHGLMIGSFLTPAGTNAYHVDLLSVADPTNTYRALQTRIALPSPPYSVAIASGRGFIAGGTSGLIVINFIPIDTLGKAPTVEIAAELVDVDPVSPGVQVEEGAFIPIRVTAVDDVQMRNVELLVNGVVVQRSITIPFNLAAVAPAIANGSNTFTIQVRATDTGENSGISVPLIVELHRDTTPFRVDGLEPSDGDVLAPDFAEARIVFSKAIAPGGANPNNFFIVGPQGQRIPPKAVILGRGGKDVKLMLDSLAPGNYSLLIHSAAVTDYAGNVLGPTDLTARFTTRTFTIRWANSSVPPAGLAWSWFNPTNWLAADGTHRLPDETDSVYINVPGKEISITTSRPTTLDPVDVFTKRINVQTLVCNEPLRLFYVDLHADEFFRVNNTLTFAGSKLTRTRLVGGPGAVLRVEGQWGRGPEEGDSVLDAARLEGEFILQTDGNPEASAFDGIFNCVNGLQLNGTMHGVGDSGNGRISFWFDAKVEGPGTFNNVDALIYAIPGHPPANVTLSSNVTFRGLIGIGMYNGTTLINEGQIIAETPHSGSPETRDGSLIDHYFTINSGQLPSGKILNRGLVEARNNDRFSIRSVVPFINEGTFRAADSGVILLNAPLISTKTICESNGVMVLEGQSLTTEPGKIAEFSGPGSWLVSRFTFQGGTVTLTDGAVLEGDALFNNVTFNGDLHNYDPNSRRPALPPYYTGYRTQMAVITNLTLNGQILFHRNPDDANSGSILFASGTGNPRLDGQGRIEFEGGSQFKNFIGQLRAGIQPGPVVLQITIGPDMIIRCHNLDIGDDVSTSDMASPFVENQGTLLVNQLGDSLRINTLGFTNSGTIQIGSSNIVTVNGRFAGTAFTQTPSGKLQFEAAGTTPGTTHGQVQVQGKAALDGTLSLSFIPPFQPKAGDVFELLTYTSHTGTFSTIATPPAPPGLQWTTDYGATSFRLLLR